MEAFNAALQMARLVAAPSPAMLEAIKHNFDICGIRFKGDVLAQAPNADWRETAVPDAPSTSVAEPAAKKSRVDETAVSAV